MLRWALATLLLANAGVYAWSQGWIDGPGGGRAQADREPARLQRQVNPQAVRVLPAASSPMTAAARLACLEAGPLPETDLAAVEGALREAEVPPTQWQRRDALRPGRWIVYMGRFADAEQLQRKQAELERRNVGFEPVQELPELQPGLQLGRYDSVEAAEQALAALAARGVRTARVVNTVAPQRVSSLRLDGLDAGTAAALASGPSGRAFRPCAASAPAG